MPDPIPDEAVEAALDTIVPGDTALGPEYREMFRDMVVSILTAAAPHIAAQAVGSDHWAHAAIAAQDAALTAQINEAVKWGREKDAELADLRAGIEALRDEMNDAMIAANQAGNDPWYRWASNTFDALNALLRGA